jgi:hypothetical protein
MVVEQMRKTRAKNAENRIRQNSVPRQQSAVSENGLGQFAQGEPVAALCLAFYEDRGGHLVEERKAFLAIRIERAAFEFKLDFGKTPFQQPR